MTTEIAIYLTIFIITLVMFFFEWVSSDVIALGVMLSLILTGLITTDEAFAGFGSETALMILGVLILTAALVRTGVEDIAGRFLLNYTGTDPQRLLLILMIVPAMLGAFMSNTASTAFFLPITFGLARRANVSASKLLMPMAFANLFSSSVTLISSSTNIIVSGLMRQNGLDPISIFELSPVGIPITIAGVVYMLVLGQRLVPDRSANDTSTIFKTQLYITEAMILPDSPLIGKTLEQSGLGRDLGILILKIIRNKTENLSTDASTVLQQDDVLLVEGQREDILKIKDRTGIDIKADAKLLSTHFKENPGELEILEVMVMPRSRLVGRTLKNFRFRERYGMQVLAINRSGETIQHKISRTALRVGDVLLIQGPSNRMRQLDLENHFRILEIIERNPTNQRRAPLATGIFFGALILAALNIVPIAVAVLIGAFLVFLTRCITPEEAYREVEWKALILIGCMLAFGKAMQESGTADYLADQIVNMSGEASPMILLTVFFTLTVILTQPMSNQAAAAVVLPVAIQTATRLNFDPRTFGIMIAVAASTSYLTPLEPACLMVYGAGNYKFIDFVKVGLPLTLIIYVISIILVPMIWPV